MQAYFQTEPTKSKAKHVSFADKVAIKSPNIVKKSFYWQLSPIVIEKSRLDITDSETTSQNSEKSGE